jgi:hypothetical protein
MYPACTTTYLHEQAISRLSESALTGGYELMSVSIRVSEDRRRTSRRSACPTHAFPTHALSARVRA